MRFPYFYKFIEEYTRFKKYLDSPTANEVYEFLSELENIQKLIIANENGKPALFGCLSVLEERFGEKEDFNFNEYFPKQCVGMMVKFILGQFGYISTVQRDMPKGSFTYFTSSMLYELRPDSAKFKLIQKLDIEPIKN
jgi:hypothetical protein